MRLIGCQVFLSVRKVLFGGTDKTGMTSLFLVIPPSPYPVRIRIDLESPSFPQICPLAPKKEDRSVTLRECYESYVSLRTLRTSTRSGYDRVVMKYCADWLDRDLSSIADDEIVKKYISIRDISGQGQAALAMRVIKALNSYAHAKFHIPERNIGKILRIAGIVSSPVRKTRFLQKADLPKWYKAVAEMNRSVAERTARDIFLVGLFTGLRRSEIFTLKWADVDLPNKTLTVRNTKNHRDHTLPLPDVLVKLFRERKSETGKSEFVFPGKSGRTAVRDIDDSRLRIVRNSGVDFSLHDLRRTFATVATEIGVPPYLLKKLLNHRSGDVTEGYVISTSEILRGPMKKVASRLMDLCRMGSPFVVAKHPSSFSSKT